MDRTTLLAVARGDNQADLLLRNGRVVNIFSGCVEAGDIAIVGDRIAGIGAGYTGRKVHDLRGSLVVPGLIDAHMHIESSLCLPAHYAAAMLPHGITTIVADPHEIGNVAGVPGIRFMAESCRGLPLTTFLMAPSCVPATNMETSGAALPASVLASLLADGTVHGLAEVMSYPGVVAGDPEVLAKLSAFEGRPRDGHAPGLSGHALNAYIAAGIGSDHECTTVAEAAEKLARGLYILVREATNARNLHTLLPLVDRYNARRICFCSDDRIPGDLVDHGSIDYMIREAIAYGIDPLDALRMATLNPAEWFGLEGRGAIAPGYLADLVVVDSFADFRPRLVYAGGGLVAANGVLAADLTLTPIIWHGGAEVHIDWHAVDLCVPARGTSLRVIGAIPDQLVTDVRVEPAKIVSGYAVADPQRDLLKIAVVERHHAGGSLGVGFIHGFGLRRGAIAGTVAHDHHNLIVIGADDASMLTAARAVADLGGGLAVAAGDQVIANLPLPVAGLMSDRPMHEVRVQYDRLFAATAELGSPLHDPFMAMSFMALAVIPKLKLTDLGLVDVEKFSFVDLFV